MVGSLEEDIKNVCSANYDSSSIRDDFDDSDSDKESKVPNMEVIIAINFEFSRFHRITI